MARSVLITDSLHSIAYDLLSESGIKCVDGSSWSRDEILDRCSTFEGWIIRSGTSIGEEYLDQATSLKVIGRAGVGVDNVDLKAATKRGVLVLNAPAGNTISTAEHTMAMLLGLARRIGPASASLKEGRWERKLFTGSELFGKTIGIIGIGKIGRTVAERCLAFGMTVVGFDPVLTQEAAERIGIELTDLETLYERADFVSVHTPLIPATKDLLNRETLAKCKKGVGVINCARGGIINEEALLVGLESGHIGGAAMDVYTSEPPSHNLAALLGHDRFLGTPHIAASTDEAQEKVARQVTEQVIRALRNEPVLTAVNTMAIRLAAQPEVRPYVVLADKLGLAARQLFPGKVERLVVRCHGDVPRKYKDVLQVIALKGFLSSSWGQPVNLINAQVVADEAGLVRDVETFRPESSFSNLVELHLEGADTSFSITGTMFSEQDVRITSVDGYEMELKAEGHLLLYRNQDRPGMLARVGQALADEGINIGSLALGRKVPGTEALTAISVDQPLTREILDKVSHIEGVRHVCMLEFMP
ncbi:MAG: phosphoglycerate dehydrogenase [Rhodothermales bacterium]|nr:phosphoglycerate dehydrogenase [Rhodothermales bacterium]MDG2016622.1 phosphoglycerate dehydrogenase [Rhodothermales bacterium]